MNALKYLRTTFLCAAAVMLAARGMAAEIPQQFVIGGKAAEHLNDHISINGETAERLAHICEDIARKNNSRVVVVILDPYGLVVHEHRMDGEGFIQIKATEQKARTALLTRAPSRALVNRAARDPNTLAEMTPYGLGVQNGGLPIVVEGQLIGAIGVGGIPPGERTKTYGEEQCARDALQEVFGPQPPLLPDAPKRGGRRAE